MTTDKKINAFLAQYDEQVIINALKLREVVLTNLPDIIEQIDFPAKIIAYCYGQKYADLICVLIPSKKGLKLGFNRGTELPDPDKILEGKGKISRYVVITSEPQIKSKAIKKLLANGLKAYQQIIKSKHQMTKEETLYTSIGRKIKSAEQSQMFGKPCFKINGKAFVCFFQNEMVFKLTSDTHQLALSLEGSQLFDPSGKNKPMKEWVQVPFVYSDKWAAFANEAKKYVNGEYKH